MYCIILYDAIRVRQCCIRAVFLKTTIIIIVTFFTEFASIYERLGVTLVERGESFYQGMMGDIVTDLESKSNVGLYLMF